MPPNPRRPSWRPAPQKSGNPSKRPAVPPSSVIGKRPVEVIDLTGDDPVVRPAKAPRHSSSSYASSSYPSSSYPSSYPTSSYPTSSYPSSSYPSSSYPSSSYPSSSYPTSSPASRFPAPSRSSSIPSSTPPAPRAPRATLRYFGDDELEPSTQDLTQSDDGPQQELYGSFGLSSPSTLRQRQHPRRAGLTAKRRESGRSEVLQGLRDSWRSCRLPEGAFQPGAPDMTEPHHYRSDLTLVSAV